MKSISRSLIAVCAVTLASTTTAFAKKDEYFSGPVRYDCGSLPAGGAELATDPLLASLAHLVEKPEPWLAASVLAYAESIDPESLDLETRLLAQNLLFRYAKVAASSQVWSSKLRETIPMKGARVPAPRAARLVLKFAPDASVFDAIGTEPDPTVESWLGPREGWTERSTSFCSDGNLLLHDQILDGLVAFRPVRSGETRALLGQIIAFDSDGRAHVTPIVERVEMRRSLAVDAPACVAHLDLASAGSPRIVADVEALHPDTFVFRDGEGVGCAGCHSRNDVFRATDVPDVTAAQALLDARRGRVEKLATDRLRSVLDLD